MDDEHVELLVIRRRVSAETFKTGDVILESVLDVLGVPHPRVGLVEFVQQVAAEFEELCFVKRLWKSFGDALASLLGIHGCWTRNDERMTSRGASA
jgi:hypothetical protein